MKETRTRIPDGVTRVINAATGEVKKFTPRKPIPGKRFFKCEDCGLGFSEDTRDCGSPSGEHCPDCLDFCIPVGAEEHPEWKTDASGNLIEPGYSDA